MPCGSSNGCELEQFAKLVFHSKKGIEMRQATEAGKKKVKYFRGKDLRKYLLNNTEKIKKMCPIALKSVFGSENVAIDSEKHVLQLGNALISEEYCCKAIYKPLKPPGPNEKATKSWPDILENSRDQKFDCNAYYIVHHEGDQSMQRLVLAFILIGVPLACMFPVWPRWTKVAIWYFLVFLGTLWLAMLLVRNAIFTLLFCFGIECWLFPRLFDPDCGWTKKWKPVWFWETRHDGDWKIFFLRCSTMVTLSVSAKKLYLYGQVNHFDGIFNQYSTILDWGVEKLESIGQIPPGPVNRGLPSLQDLGLSKCELDDGECNATDENTVSAMEEYARRLHEPGSTGHSLDVSDEGEVMSLD